MLKWRFLLWLALPTLALAESGPRLVINGAGVPGTTVSVGGKTYVPLDALRAAGARISSAGGVLSITLGPPAGGANPLAATQGCLGQTLFNGVWRLKVSELQLLSDDNNPRWAINVEVRNGANKTLQPVFAGLRADEDHVHLILPDGTPAQMNVGDTLAGQKLSFASLPPGGVWRGQLSFHDQNGADPARRPNKLLFEVRPEDNSSKVNFSVKDPSFRIDLTCQK